MIRVKEDYVMKELQVFINGLKQGIIKTTANSKWVFFSVKRGKSVEYKDFFSLRKVIDNSMIKYDNEV